MMATQIQREYLANARKAIRIAHDVKFNGVAYSQQTKRAEAYWTHFLKSTGSTRVHESTARLRAYLKAKDTRGALEHTAH